MKRRTVNRGARRCRSAPTELPTIKVGGVAFVVSGLDAATDWLLDEVIPCKRALNVRLANAYTVALANSDHEYGRLLASEGVNLPDGIPVVWFMQLRNSRGDLRPERVRGPTFFVKVLEESTTRQTRHFLLGGRPETLERLKSSVATTNPDVTIVGAFSPPFAPADSAFIEDCARRIEKATPDVVWISLGTPKQDIVGTALAARLGIPTVNVGAAFDFAAGTSREAPVWVQRSGFEWLFRLACEPRRLWKRYLIGNAQFLVAAVRNRDIERCSS